MRRLVICDHHSHYDYARRKCEWNPKETVRVTRREQLEGIAGDDIEIVAYGPCETQNAHDLIRLAYERSRMRRFPTPRYLRSV